MSFALRRMPGFYAVARLAPDASLPDWLRLDLPFVSVSRTSDELTIVCAEAFVPAEVRAEREFAAFVVDGPLAFDQVGVLSTLSSALASAGISLLGISTYDTDYFLVRRGQASRAEQAWREIGCDVMPAPGAPV